VKKLEKNNKKKKRERSHASFGIETKKETAEVAIAICFGCC